MRLQLKLQVTQIDLFDVDIPDSEVNDYRDDDGTWDYAELHSALCSGTLRVMVESEGVECLEEAIVDVSELPFLPARSTGYRIITHAPRQ